ncbi:uncharacterized [Tachysurus ichikawai]
MNCCMEAAGDRRPNDVGLFASPRLGNSHTVRRSSGASHFLAPSAFKRMSKKAVCDPAAHCCHPADRRSV